MVVSDDTVESIVDALVSDAVYALLDQQIEITDNGFQHNQQHISVATVHTESIWRDSSIDLVIDTITSNPGKREEKKHTKAGADKVIFCCPTTELPVVHIGANEQAMETAGSAISGGGPESAAVQPIIDILTAAFGVDHAVATTIKGNLCGSACDCQGACECYEHTDDIPAPVLVSALTVLTLQTKRALAVQTIHDALIHASESLYYQGIVAVAHDSLPPDGVIGESVSALVDLSRTQVDGRLISLKLWYDREWSYANRIVELTADYGKIKKGKK